MRALRFLWKIVSNKYFLTTVAFITWIVFFDSNNFSTRNQLQEKLDALNSEKQFYLQEIKRDSLLTEALIHDSTALERFARERYLMKKDKEDLYLVIDTTADQRQ